MRASIQETAFDPKTLRTVLGHYPSGVTVVTAMDGSVPVGFACQSFHALSLDPPMVVILVGKHSTSWPRIRSAETFAVNVLSEGQETLCRSFAVSGADKFAGVEWAPSRFDAPILEGSSAWFDCRIEAEHDGGDHLIVAARILDLGIADDRLPLVFHRGTFRTMTSDK
jgi:flavin reductase (DIM6/NTAB) family NADH-FMN oxidoreductase RutF